MFYEAFYPFTFTLFSYKITLLQMRRMYMIKGVVRSFIGTSNFHFGCSKNNSTSKKICTFFDNLKYIYFNGVPQHKNDIASLQKELKLLRQQLEELKKIKK
jgi:hypothetical protein